MREHFGRTGEDLITGYRGIIIGYADYMTGCEQVLLVPRCDPEKENERPDGEWFDAERVTLVTKPSGGYNTLYLSTDLVKKDDQSDDENERERLDRSGGPRTDRPAPKR